MREAVSATLRDAASLAPGSALVMSFMLPVELACLLVLGIGALVVLCARAP